jgi:O-antigen ligase
MSTMRGANPLGAYLTLITTVLAGLLLKNKKRRLEGSILLLGTILVLIFSYSRSAWIGAAMSLAALGFMSLSAAQIKRIAFPFIGAFLIIGIVAVFSYRHNPTFENIFFHTQTNSDIKTTSDQGHLTAFKNGVHDLWNEPLGRGIGTAGPASVYNRNNVRISENYYLQIAQETGWIGLILFIAINYLVACELWLKRDDLLARILLASLIGITFINLLSHAWTDDTLAYLWWGLAGIALTPILTDRQKTHGKKIKAKS